MSTYDYYIIDSNRFKKRLWEKYESNTKLELKLEAIRVQFKDAFNYLNKKYYKVEQLEIVIDQLIVVKIKSDTILPLIENLIYISRHFGYALFFTTN